MDYILGYKWVSTMRNGCFKSQWSNFAYYYFGKIHYDKIIGKECLDFNSEARILIGIPTKPTGKYKDFIKCMNEYLIKGSINCDYNYNPSDYNDVCLYSIILQLKGEKPLHIPQKENGEVNSIQDTIICSLANSPKYIETLKFKQGKVSELFLYDKPIIIDFFKDDKNFKIEFSPEKEKLKQLKEEYKFIIIPKCYDKELAYLADGGLDNSCLPFQEEGYIKIVNVKLAQDFYLDVFSIILIVGVLLTLLVAFIKEKLIKNIF